MIRLAEGAVPADRDFELTWKPRTGERARRRPVPRARRRRGLSARLRHAAGARADARTAAPREIIFVIDNSGSMGGTSMRAGQGQPALRACAGSKPGDRFNVIRFDDTMEMLFPDAVPADAEHVGARARLRRRARGQRRHGDGAGAEGRADAIRAARRQASCARWSSSPTARSATSSSCSTRIAPMRGRSRVFMVGIGSAPNSYLMTRAAELGRGSLHPYRLRPSRWRSACASCSTSSRSPP